MRMSGVGAETNRAGIFQVCIYGGLRHPNSLIHWWREKSAFSMYVVVVS